MNAVDLKHDKTLELELSYEDGRRARGVYTLPLLIGRGMECGLILRSWRVARQHVRLDLRGGEVWIEDLGSLLGTIANGARVFSQRALQVQDELVVGPCLLRVIRLPSGVEALRNPDRPASRSEDVSPTQAEGEGPRNETDARRHLSTAIHEGKDDRTPEEANLIDPALSGLDAEMRSHRRRLHAELIAALQLRRRDIHTMSDRALRADAQAVLSDLIAKDTLLPTSLDRSALVRALVDEAVGLGPLEPLLADSSITEIMVNRHDEIFIERQGRLEPSGQHFSSEQAVLGVIDRIVAPLGRRIDDSSPMVDARLRDGSRVNAVIAPVALRGTSLTIRKFPARRLIMGDLLAAGALDKNMAIFLEQSVRQRKNIVVSGGTGSGKTSLLNILSNAIPAGERVVTIEDAAELRLSHKHLVSLEARPANLEGKGRIEIRDLVRNALRMRPDRIVVGECRGTEAFDMLAAMNTGHEGSLTTLHANSPRDALGRLETMILMAGMDLPLTAVREHIAASIDLIVQLVRAADGRRLVCAIVQVVGTEAGRVQLQELFLARPGPPAVFRGCGLMPEGFSAAGAMDIALFSQETVCSGRRSL